MLAMRTCPTCGSDLSGSHASRKWCSDRCRKAQYDLTCVVCGGRVDGTTPGKMPDPDKPVCGSCKAAYYAKWDRDGAVTAIQRFVDRYGKAPAAVDFNPALARSLGRPEKSERFYRDGDYPHLTTLNSLFGGWNGAIEAAGLTPRPRGAGGRYYPGDDPAKVEDAVRLYAEGHSSSVVSAATGISQECILRHLRERGVVRPPGRPRKEAA